MICNKPFCYHHNDADGRAAGFIVWKYLKLNGVTTDFYNYEEVDYQSKLDSHSKDSDTIFIVDYSFTHDTVHKLYNICETAKRVIWIDHHQSSIDLIKDSVVLSNLRAYGNVSYMVNESRSGAYLTWLFSAGAFTFDATRCPDKDSYTCELTPVSRDGDSRIPDWVCYIDDYDRWQFKLSATKDFIAGLNSYDNKLFVWEDGKAKINSVWTDLLNVNAMSDHCINSGKAINRYIISKYKNDMFMCFDKQVYQNGNMYTVTCKNSNGNSRNFGEDISKYDAVSLFWYDAKNKKWYHSIYSANNSPFDCAKFAEILGGGGHKHAAGFSLEYPLWLKD